MSKFVPANGEKIVFQSAEHVAETISHFTTPLADALCLVSELVIGSQDCEDMDDRMKLEISFYRANEVVEKIIEKGTERTLNEFYIANALLAAIDTAKKNLADDSEEESPKIILLN